MRRIRLRASFRRDMKGLPRRIGYDFNFEMLDYAADLFLAGEPLPKSWRPHALGAGRADWRGYMECHLASDWLLVYVERGEEIVWVRTGTHAELFGGL